LYDNAENLDVAVNSPSADVWTDRLGQARKTWRGIQSEAQLEIAQVVGEVTAQSQQYLDESIVARDEARAAASASGPIAFFGTYEAAQAAVGGLPDGGIVEVSQDETRAGARARYKVQAGALVFLVNLDQTKLDLAAATGASLVGFTDAQGNVGTVAGLATKQIMRNNKTSATVAGEVPGLKIGICDGTEAGWRLNPAAGDFVAIYPYVVSSAVRNRVWAMNPIVDIPSGSPATAWCYEGNINVGTADTPDPRSTNHALGADMVSGGTFAPSAAFATYSSTLANRWKHGLWFDNVGGQVGSSLIKSNVNVSVDFGIDLGSATINYQGLRIGATPPAQVAAVGIRQLNNNQVGIHLQRNTDTVPTGNLLQIVNAANSIVMASIDASANITTQGNIFTSGEANITAGGVTQSRAHISTAEAPTVGAGQVSYGATLANAATAGSAGALPATPANYIIINVAGVTGKIPFYNA